MVADVSMNETILRQKGAQVALAAMSRGDLKDAWAIRSFDAKTTAVAEFRGLTEPTRADLYHKILGVDKDAATELAGSKFETLTLNIAEKAREMQQKAQTDPASAGAAEKFKGMDIGKMTKGITAEGVRNINDALEKNPELTKTFEGLASGDPATIKHSIYKLSEQYPHINAQFGLTPDFMKSVGWDKAPPAAPEAAPQKIEPIAAVPADTVQTVAPKPLEEASKPKPVQASPAPAAPEKAAHAPDTAKPKTEAEEISEISVRLNSKPGFGDYFAALSSNDDITRMLGGMDGGKDGNSKMLEFYRKLDQKAEKDDQFFVKANKFMKDHPGIGAQATLYSIENPRIGDTMMGIMDFLKQILPANICQGLESLMGRFMTPGNMKMAENLVDMTKSVSNTETVGASNSNGKLTNDLAEVLDLKGKTVTYGPDGKIAAVADVAAIEAQRKAMNAPGAAAPT